MANETSAYVAQLAADLQRDYPLWECVVRAPTGSVEAQADVTVEVGVADGPQTVEWDGFQAVVRADVELTLYYRAVASNHRSFYEAVDIAHTLAAWAQERRFQAGHMVTEVAVLVEPVEIDGVGRVEFMRGDVQWTDYLVVTPQITYEGAEEGPARRPTGLIDLTNIETVGVHTEFGRFTHEVPETPIGPGEQRTALIVGDNRFLFVRGENEYLEVGA